MKLTLPPRWQSVAAGALMALGLALPSTADADLLMNEDFSSCTPGNLYQQNGWMRHTTSASVNDDIVVAGFAMSYSGYQSTSTAKAAQIHIGNNTSPQEKLKKQFRDKTDSTEPVYYAFLMNLSEVPTNAKASYFFAFVTANANADTGLSDIKGGNEYGRVFAYKGDTDGKFKLGFSKNGATMAAKTTTEYDLNTTVLVICKWEYVDGSTNDVYKYWINPVKSDAEPEAADYSVNSGADPTIGTNKQPIQGVEIRQGLTSSKMTPSGYVGAIRVATSWADLWESGDEPGPGPIEKPAIMPGASKVEFGEVFQGMADVVKTINVKAEYLTGDITVGGLTNITPSATTISKEDAMSEAGYDLTLTMSAASPLSLSETLVLSSEGATSVNVPLSGTVYAVTEKPALSFLNKLSEDDYNIYKYTGNAVVTFVDAQNSIIYAQDATGGIKISLEYFYGTNTLKRGDKITDMYCSYADVYGGGAVMPVQPVIATVVSEGNEVEPIEVSLSEINSQRAEYLSRLVKVSDVTFTGYREGLTFSSASTPISSGEATGAARSFPGTDLVGTEVPQNAASITGISTSSGSVIVSMRGISDLELAPANVEIEKEMLISNDWQEINGEYPHTKFTVKTTNLKSPLSIWLGGAGRSHFAVDVEEIPAGSATTIVTVMYKPTAKGTHSCNINFDASPAELSQSIALSGRAWDPANPPAITVDSSSLQPFEAKVGESQEQTLSYTADGLLDYGTARVAGTSNGAFRISTSSLMKDGTYNIVVTFNPKEEGTFTETIEFVAEKAETRTVTVTGSTSGGKDPEQKQGDELSYDVMSPQALVIEDFENCGEKNKPLAIDGWKNVALEGTRAWWAYQFDDNNTAAKITAYDSQAQEDMPCQMMLLSPALSFKDAANRVLAFRVMGQYLNQGQPDLLEVCYIDPTESVTEPYIEPIGGLDIPAIADYNDEWVPYTIDLEGQDLADVFFIGFRFTSTRGKNSSAVYYVDDFSWGRTDLPFIRPAVTEHELYAVQGQEYSSDEIAVTGLNLTNGISLSIIGPNASKFSVTPETLPAEGGNIRVKFLSDEVGLHEAYVRIVSEGAPDSYIHLLAHNGIDAIDGVAGDAAESEVADVYTVSGVLVARDITLEEAQRTLTPGIYVFGTKKLVIR